MKTIALILARGGSKGIPKKNIIKIKDKPLIEYAIDASLSSEVSETWVSTDCEEIKKVAIKGLSFILIMFFLGIPLLPPLAKIRAMVFIRNDLLFFLKT